MPLFFYTNNRSRDRGGGVQPPSPQQVIGGPAEHLTPTFTLSSETGGVRARAAHLPAERASQHQHRLSHRLESHLPAAPGSFRHSDQVTPQAAPAQASGGRPRRQADPCGSIHSETLRGRPAPGVRPGPEARGGATRGHLGLGAGLLRSLWWGYDRRGSAAGSSQAAATGGVPLRGRYADRDGRYGRGAQRGGICRPGADGRGGSGGGGRDGGGPARGDGVVLLWRGESGRASS